MNADFLVKLRDALQMAADACQERLEQMAPKEEKYSWNPNNITFQKAEGSRGVYEKAMAEGQSQNSDFVALVEDLKKHDGKLSRHDWFYWLFDRPPTTVGRKKRR